MLSSAPRATRRTATRPNLSSSPSRRKALVEMAAAGSIVIEPDWGWVTGVEAAARHRGEECGPLGWKDSLAACGCVCISGFEDRFKSLLDVRPAPLDEEMEREPPAP